MSTRLERLSTLLFALAISSLILSPAASGQTSETGKQLPAVSSTWG